MDEANPLLVATPYLQSGAECSPEDCLSDYGWGMSLFFSILSCVFLFFFSLFCLFIREVHYFQVIFVEANLSF
jgi:hypothetical protein